jgi:hypothetical protein
MLLVQEGSRTTGSVVRISLDEEGIGKEKTRIKKKVGERGKRSVLKKKKNFFSVGAFIPAGGS